jgi:hypothetical protein
VPSTVVVEAGVIAVHLAFTAGITTTLGLVLLAATGTSMALLQRSRAILLLILLEGVPLLNRAQQLASDGTRLSVRHLLTSSRSCTVFSLPVTSSIERSSKSRSISIASTN